MFMVNTVPKVRFPEQQIPSLDLLESGDPHRHIAICISAKHKAAALRMIVAKSNGILNNIFAEDACWLGMGAQLRKVDVGCRRAAYKVHAL